MVRAASPEKSPRQFRGVGDGEMRRVGLSSLNIGDGKVWAVGDGDGDGEKSPIVMRSQMKVPSDSLEHDAGRLPPLAVLGSPRENGERSRRTEDPEPLGPIWIRLEHPFIFRPSPPVKAPPPRAPRPPYPPVSPSPPVFWPISRPYAVPPADVSMYFGWVTAPDPKVLASGHRFSLQYLPDHQKPTALMGRTWICPVCEISYPPSYNLFANIQEPECRKCKIKNNASYDWTITRVLVNGVQLDFSCIYLQNSFWCTIYAFMAMADLLRKIRGAYRGWIEPAKLCSHGIFGVYQQVNGYALGDEPHMAGRVENLLTSVCRLGAPFVTTMFRCNFPTEEYPHSSLKIKCWFRIPVKEVDVIVRLLANGVPLMGLLPLGKLFRYLKAKQVYHAPSLDTSDSLHAVVLHGSAYAAQDGKFYKCRNSWGNRAHGDYTKMDCGADFEARCSDFVYYMYGFELA